ncbi:putative S-adenosylmethionine-dependent methyltransferase [Sesamum alatum]|uniref:S-adenosylmethionine-dependent methyltransferase n=1 Tax=Sesamum alatum TaxID=300844 RepID=A0AAE1Y4F3_9LAMI|nr:putative S-adenosylmethionine-dependent methyltransferase [Sesamum alatum]
MAQLYAMVNCFQYPRMSIRMTLSSPLDSRHRIQCHVELPNLYAMNGGEGPNSYAQNSSYHLCIFRFKHLSRNYHAVGVPGPFHGRILPEASLDFAYCSCTLNWLSEVPKEVADHNSPAWNNGKVHYTEARQEVFDAYSNHYASNIAAFLDARAKELVQGGLMALLVPAVPAFKNYGTSYTTPTEMDLIDSCLVDMAKKGRFREEKVDSFNFPLYFTIPEELKITIARSDSFNIERMEILNNPGKRTLPRANARATYLRAVFEGLLINHFGSEIMDELFELYAKKLAASPHFLGPDNEKSIIIFVLLKHN